MADFPGSRENVREADKRGASPPIPLSFCTLSVSPYGLTPLPEGEGVMLSLRAKSKILPTSLIRGRLWCSVNFQMLHSRGWRPRQPGAKKCTHSHKCMHFLHFALYIHFYDRTIIDFMEQKIKQNERIGEKIRNIRKTKDLGQTDLVRMLQIDGCDMTRECLVKIERCTQHIQVSQLRTIRKALDTSYELLIDGL